MELLSWVRDPKSKERGSETSFSEHRCQRDCGKMDIRFKGGFKVPNNINNINIHKHWINFVDEQCYQLGDSIFFRTFVILESYINNKIPPIKIRF